MTVSRKWKKYCYSDVQLQLLQLPFLLHVPCVYAQTITIVYTHDNERQAILEIFIPFMS